MQQLRHSLQQLAVGAALALAVPLFLLVFAATFPLALAAGSLRHFAGR